MTSRGDYDSDLGAGRQNRRRAPVTRDTTNGQEDTPASPRDSGDRPNRQPNESRYAAASAALPPLQRTGWTPGSNQVIEPSLTRPDLAPLTAEQRKEVVVILTAMILDLSLIHI